MSHQPQQYQENNSESLICDLKITETAVNYGNHNLKILHNEAIFTQGFSLLSYGF